MQKRSLWVLAMFLVYQDSFAGGFQITPTANAVPRALAGSGVAGDELGEQFFNPASLTLHDVSRAETTRDGDASESEASPDRIACEAGLVFLTIENKFENRGSTQSLNIPSTPTPIALPATGSNYTTSDDGFIFASFCRMQTPNPKLKVGFGMGPTFGLRNRYSPDWVGRYQAIDSELLTINLNPSFSYDINDHLTVGAGFSIEYADAIFSRAVFTGFGSPDGHARIRGDDVGYGYNLGLIWHLREDARLGIGFRSKIEHTLEGKRRLLGLGSFDGKVDAAASTTLPETIFLSAIAPLPLGVSNLSIAATARWTNWSRFDEIRVTFSDGSPNDVTVQNWRDSWTLGLALAFQPDDWKYTVGAAYDESPATSEFRNARVPDSNRILAGAGIQYLPRTSQWSAELAYQRILVSSRSIRTSIDLNPNAPGTLVDNLIGEYAGTDVDVFGVRIGFRF